MGLSNKFEKLEATCAAFPACHNFCRRTREPGKDEKRLSVTIMAGVVDGLWSLDELYKRVTTQAAQFLITMFSARRHNQTNQDIFLSSGERKTWI